MPPFFNTRVGKSLNALSRMLRIHAKTKGLHAFETFEESFFIYLCDFFSLFFYYLTSFLSNSASYQFLHFSKLPKHNLFPDFFLGGNLEWIFSQTFSSQFEFPEFSQTFFSEFRDFRGPFFCFLVSLTFFQWLLIQSRHFSLSILDHFSTISWLFVDVPSISWLFFNVS